MRSEDYKAVEEYLRELGATDEEVAEARVGEQYSELALDLVLRPPGEILDFATAAEQAGLSLDEAAQLWRAFGFPDPFTAPPRIAPDMADALKLFSATSQLLGPEAALALARVLGASTARLANAIVDSFRVQFELPRLHSGTPYSEIVRGYVDVARTMVPPAFEALGAVMRRHILEEAQGTWSWDDERATTGRELVVGFVDLVAYTALSRTLTPRQLAELVSRFEAVVGDVVSGHDGRVVKLIGDGAMFVVDSVADGCRLALGLVERVGAEGDLPPVRVALAHGSVVALHGDYYGDVVNLAARLLAVAAPSTVVASEPTAREAEAAGGFRVEALPASSLKGIPGPSAAFRIL